MLMPFQLCADLENMWEFPATSIISHHVEGETSDAEGAGTELV